MSALERTTVHQLNALIEACKRGQEYFSTAAETLPEPALASLLGDFSRDRLQFCLELQEVVRKTAESPEERSSAINTVYRGWSDNREKFPADRAAILGLCEREEDAAISLYHEVLQSEHLAEDLRTMLERHHKSLLECRDRLHVLRG